MKVFRLLDFCSQLKILVPNTTAGMIIGKGGNYVKQIKEDSGSYVQLSQKSKEQILQERCITIIGKLMYLLGIAASDPHTEGNFHFLRKCVYRIF
jgi:RNA-binding protein Nova